MPTITSEQIPGLLTAAVTIKNNGSIVEAKYRSHPVWDPLGTVVGSAITQGLLLSGWQQHLAPAKTTQGYLGAEWHQALADLSLDDCFRMMAAHEIGRGCGFDVNFNDHQGSFIVWGSPRNQVDGFGNAVSPPVAEWIGGRLRMSVLGSEAA